MDLNPDNLLSFIAPKITPIPSMRAYVFSFRISLCNRPGKCINNPSTRAILNKHNTEVNISNATSDSGDTIETAGYIIFKHPKLTHRHYYLQNLRRHLQTSTPFFDLGYHRKSPTGQLIPHIAVRCGENHVSSLTDILTSHLDGTDTALFLGRLLISSMSPVQVDSLFQANTCGLHF
jgi:hypothetical protein